MNFGMYGGQDAFRLSNRVARLRIMFKRMCKVNILEF